MDFQPTFVYVKTHNKTGLKYFGVTSRQDYHIYQGSGKDWLIHLKMNGIDYSTSCLGYYEDKEECMRYCSAFCEINNIVKCKKWANIILEHGCTYKRTEETKKKIGDANRRRIYTDVMRKNMTRDLRGNKNACGKQRKITCPHCKKEGGVSNIKRYHFDNCKTIRLIK